MKTQSENSYESTCFLSGTCGRLRSERGQFLCIDLHSVCIWRCRVCAICGWTWPITMVTMATRGGGTVLGSKVTTRGWNTVYRCVGTHTKTELTAKKWSSKVYHTCFCKVTRYGITIQLHLSTRGYTAMVGSLLLIFPQWNKSLNITVHVSFFVKQPNQNCLLL